MSIIDEFYQNKKYSTTCNIAVFLEVFDYCYHYMIQETFCETLASVMDAHLTNKRIHISELNFSNGIKIDFQCQRQVTQQEKLSLDVATDLDTMGMKTMTNQYAIGKIKRDSKVIQRVNQGHGLGTALPYLCGK